MKQSSRFQSKLSAVAFILLASAQSLAQPQMATTLESQLPKTSSTTVQRAEGAPRIRRAVKAKVDKKVGIQAPTIGNFTYTAVLKNTMTMGRKYELEEYGGRNFWLTNEIYTGFKHKSGWSIQATAAIRQKDYNDSSRDSRGVIRDSSLVLGHPAIVKSASLDLAGQFRAYVPTSNYSRENGFRQFRYYSFADIKMPKNWGLSNLFMPMFFKQDVMAADFADVAILEALELTHQTTKSIRLGLGQQTQYEHHKGTLAGTTVEVYPFADLEFIPNVLIEPKLYLPLFARGIVDAAPQAVALAQMQAELILKIGF